MGNIRTVCTSLLIWCVTATAASANMRTICGILLLWSVAASIAGASPFVSTKFPLQPDQTSMPKPVLFMEQDDAIYGKRRHAFIWGGRVGSKSVDYFGNAGFMNNCQTLITAAHIVESKSGTKKADDIKFYYYAGKSNIL